VLRKLDEVAQKKNLTHEELAVLASWYGRYKQKEKAKKYEALALQKNPKGEFAEQHRFIKIYEEQDSDRKLALFNQFVKDFPKSNNTAQLYGILTNYYFTREDSAGLQRFIEQYGKHIPDGTYNSLAQKLYEGGKNLPLAESLAVQAVAQAREALGRQSEEKPDSYSDKMWKTMREYALGKALGTYGTILDKRGKPEAAYNSLKEAAAIQKGKDTETNELYVALLTKTNRQKEAMVAGEQFIGEGKGTVKMKEDLRQAYIAVNGNEKGYDRYLASLEAPAREKMKSELARKMISEPAPAFSLQDLNGNPVSLAELKGKTIVVDFWATWCGPCVASMPAMQQAMNKYKDNPDVKFLFINSWQNEPDKQKVVSEFLRKKKFDFTVPLDAENKVITAYKVDGIPTKFVIDPQGNIRFKSVGFSGGPDGLVEELSMMINMAAGKEL
jgi:thiol-disulfide isomerase/thioredoxin